MFFCVTLAFKSTPIQPWQIWQPKYNRKSDMSHVRTAKYFVMFGLAVIETNITLEKTSAAACLLNIYTTHRAANPSAAQ